MRSFISHSCRRQCTLGCVVNQICLNRSRTAAADVAPLTYCFLLRRWGVSSSLRSVNPNVYLFFFFYLYAAQRLLPCHELFFLPSLKPTFHTFHGPPGTATTPHQSVDWLRAHCETLPETRSAFAVTWFICCLSPWPPGDGSAPRHVMSHPPFDAPGAESSGESAAPQRGHPAWTNKNIPTGPKGHKALNIFPTWIIFQPLAAIKKKWKLYLCIVQSRSPACFFTLWLSSAGQSDQIWPHSYLE